MKLRTSSKNLRKRSGLPRQLPWQAWCLAGLPREKKARGAAEEKTEFTVVLTAIGANKINVIKAVREVTSLGLKEAKEFGGWCAQAHQGRAFPKEEAENVMKKIL